MKKSGAFHWGYSPSEMAFSPDGRLIASGGSRGGITLADAATGEVLGNWDIHSDDTYDYINELAVGLLCQKIRELGILPDCLENSEMKLLGIANEVLQHVKQGKFELPGRIRLFCQKR